ncbi:fimbria/pilus periplasmic chaperone [Achromobacter pestifer]|uniref:Putative fimbrial chaperone YadV n=1 Tax=Achromobacter pestifer TaxID=1353889 RepID=A0A6S6YIE9_9BURK|nr:fimbria/pilus periplasmic chaperone [Achromobacter pestifer]CAB3624922.1 putative fimbrial chaperone YadV [Achromobacter pestifer]
MTPVVRRVFVAVMAGVMTWAACASLAQAALVLVGTRVVYPSDAKDVTIRAMNEGSEPLLAQIWVDDGSAGVAPANMIVPFTVSPVITRIDPNSSAIIRLMYTKDPLPDDRESLFYLNVLEAPPRSASDTSATFSFRTRIKLFFRPASLRDGIEDAREKLEWKLVKPSTYTAVEVKNPTPYHVSFGSIGITVGGKRTRLGSGMVAPYGTEHFRLPKGMAIGAGKIGVEYEVINDHGGRHPVERALSR